MPGLYPWPQVCHDKFAEAGLPQLDPKLEMKIKEPELDLTWTKPITNELEREKKYLKETLPAEESKFEATQFVMSEKRCESA